MIYLMTQIALSLVIAALIGAAAGWSLHRLRRTAAQETQREALAEARRASAKANKRLKGEEQRVEALAQEIALERARSAELGEALEQQRERIHGLERVRAELDSALRGAEQTLEQERRGRLVDRQSLQTAEAALRARRGAESSAGPSKEANGHSGGPAPAAALTATVEALRGRLEKTEAERDALAEAAAAGAKERDALARALDLQRGDDDQGDPRGLNQRLAESQAQLLARDAALARGEERLREAEAALNRLRAQLFAREAELGEAEARLKDERESHARERESAEGIVEEVRLALKGRVRELEATLSRLP